MDRGPRLTLSVDCGDLNKKTELHLGSSVLRIFEEGNHVYKAVF